MEPPRRQPPLDVALSPERHFARAWHSPADTIASAAGVILTVAFHLRRSGDVLEHESGPDREAGQAGSTPLASTNPSHASHLRLAQEGRVLYRVVTRVMFRVTHRVTLETRRP